MTNIKSSLGNFNHSNNRQPPQPGASNASKKHYFVSDESEENFAIPELDNTPQNNFQHPERIDFQSAEQFNQFRNSYLKEAKKKEAEEKKSIENELKQNIEILLGIGVRDDKIVIDNFGFQLRTLGDAEKQEIEKELILLRHETLQECPGITEAELNTLMLVGRVRRVLAKSIFSVFLMEGGKEVRKQPFDSFIGSSNYQDKLQITSNFQEPLRNILFALYSKIDNAAPQNFPTIESLANEIKK